MKLVVLGAAAGGGFPQWNCNCASCLRGRQDETMARTQASIAVSADGADWVLINASPDLPHQLRANAVLHPRAGAGIRHSPLKAAVISCGDIDCIAGLLSLREAQALAVYAGRDVLDIIADNRIFDVLNPDLVKFRTLDHGAPIALHDAAGLSLGLAVRAFPVPGKIPLYQETSNEIQHLASATAVLGLAIHDRHGGRIVYIPGCMAVTGDVLAQINGADILFFDGTVWEDDEMISTGAGAKTGRRMGHMSIAGRQGSMAALAAAKVGMRVFIHINNTNQLLCADSPQAAIARAAGWEIAHDGMELSL